MRLLRALAILAVAVVVPSSAPAITLIVDRLDTPDVVQAGSLVSFAFSLQFEPDEVLLGTQAEISAPHLTGFQPHLVSGPNPWDLWSNMALRGTGNPMWVHAEDAYGEDPPGVTWDEVGGIAPLGGFTAIATYNGEIELNFVRTSWELLLFGGARPYLGLKVPFDPAYEHYKTGVTIVGGLELPPPPPPREPPALPPDDPPPAVSVPSDDPPLAAPEPGLLCVGALLALALRRVLA